MPIDPATMPADELAAYEAASREHFEAGDIDAAEFAKRVRAILERRRELERTR